MPSPPPSSQSSGKLAKLGTLVLTHAVAAAGEDKVLDMVRDSKLELKSLTKSGKNVNFLKDTVRLCPIPAFECPPRHTQLTQTVLRRVWTPLCLYSRREELKLGGGRCAWSLVNGFSCNLISLPVGTVALSMTYMLFPDLALILRSIYTVHTS